MTYIEFTEVADTGKTKVWDVHNTRDGSKLGQVRWYGAWRKYVLHSRNAIWSPDCLFDVMTFIDKQMAERKTKT